MLYKLNKEPNLGGGNHVLFTNDEEREEYLVGLEAQRTNIKLNKPIYTGFTVLELSKHLMYDFHYNHILKKYGPQKAHLLFTDTDSLTYVIETDDVYEDMKENQDLYDTSEYPLGFSNINKWMWKRCARTTELKNAHHDRRTLYERVSNEPNPTLCESGSDYEG